MTDTELEWIKGELEFFSETGTEGGSWAFYDSRFSHGLDFDCGSPDCPTNIREELDRPGHYSTRGEGKRISETHGTYEGLYILQDGDVIRVHLPNGDTHTVTVKLLRQNPYKPDSYYVKGMLTSHYRPQPDVDPDEWDEWFVRRYPAEIKGGYKPTREANPLLLWPEGHWK